MATSNPTGTMLGGFYVPGHNRVVLQETPIPTPTAKQVLIKVVAAGVCHSDVFFLSASAPDPRTYILGHENAGYAVSWGSEVTGIDKDQLYIVYLTSPCAEQAQAPITGLDVIGVGANGGYAEYLVVDADQLVPVPKGLSPEIACLSADSLITAYNAVHNVAGLRPGTKKRVLIYGVGGLGHQALQIAKSYGATVYACDFKPEARELALSLGAERVFDAAELQAATADTAKEPLAVDIGIDFVVNAQSFSLLASAVKRAEIDADSLGGLIVLVGATSDELSFSSVDFINNRISVKTTFYGTIDDCKASLDLLAKGIVKPVVSTEPLYKVVDVLDELKANEYLGRKVMLPAAYATD
ncbi:N-benzyl-3-pyrrolidinol dehydrogenase [Lentinus tigrinus ALCF2SS1-7]|uniref:N-benzyl-3-pyrrolidinol dehydrogenase n=1 Tax=Lentinus tigrinus ALCF2SS1-6 TaxID=1328759 RepID=A0A5C2RZD6_9APHY|nr:N-benzyl-3-pyrrolidinol dehydrogenase [Lentinus tigrinus ALCF2SS1-6]RPD71531.1 N-benzyl-3-pyrrolidinol dehydrogenase [Lentinus tigrinus ALCF2SS1-7]